MTQRSIATLNYVFQRPLSSTSRSQERSIATLNYVVQRPSSKSLRILRGSIATLNCVFQRLDTRGWFDLSYSNTALKYVSQGTYAISEFELQNLISI